MLDNLSFYIKKIQIYFVLRIFFKCIFISIKKDQFDKVQSDSTIKPTILIEFNSIQLIIRLRG